MIHNDNEITSSDTGILIGAGSAMIEDNDNSIHGNVIGIDVDSGTVLVQNNDLNGNTIGVRIQNGGIADLGQTGKPVTSNYTGLGISTGGNDFSGYTTPATSTGSRDCEPQCRCGGWTAGRSAGYYGLWQSVGRGDTQRHRKRGLPR